MKPVVLLLAILSLAGPAAAARPQILFAEADLDDPGYPDGLLHVSGFDFGIGDPGVILGGMVLRIVSSTPIHVVAELPSSLAPGTYNVTIVTGNRPRQSVSAEVAIGAQGLPGLPGSPGLPGTNGTNGSPGEDGVPGLACWDRNGNGSCDGLAGEPGSEDVDESGSCNALDCRGPAGAPGTDPSARIAELEARIDALEALVGNCGVEVCDGLDNDCDGQVDEGLSGCSGAAQPPAPGDLVVTEIMRNPNAVLDSVGEWFEVLNVTAHTLILDGCEIRDDGGEQSPIDAVEVPPGSFLVFANNPDPNQNGGVFPVVPYAGVVLGNIDDEIVIACDGVQIDRVAYDALFPAMPGASQQLDPGTMNAVENDVAANWCNSTTAFGLGDLGTPGAANGSCQP